MMQQPDATIRVFLSAATADLIERAESYVRSLYGDRAEITRVPYDRFASIGTRAEQANSDLIVLAVQADEEGKIDPESTFARFSLDSDIPVMVLRGRSGVDAEVGQAGRIVVPLDGSATAAQVLPLVARLARTTGLPVRFVMVIDPSRVIPAAYAYDPEAWGVISDLRQTAHWALRQAEERLRADGISVESELLFGPVNACLRDVIAADDMVVMTTHGSGRATRRRVGSVARRVLESTPQPLMIMRVAVPGDVVVEGYEACSWVEPLGHRPRT
jgi:nucleotide-binding universal stress UspA family protein